MFLRPRLTSPRPSHSYGNECWDVTRCRGRVLECVSRVHATCDATSVECFVFSRPLDVATVACPTTTSMLCRPRRRLGISLRSQLRYNLLPDAAAGTVPYPPISAVTYYSSLQLQYITVFFRQYWKRVILNKVGGTFTTQSPHWNRASLWYCAVKKVPCNLFEMPYYFSTNFLCLSCTKMWGRVAEYCYSKLIRSHCCAL